MASNFEYEQEKPAAASQSKAPARKADQQEAAAKGISRADADRISMLKRLRAQRLAQASQVAPQERKESVHQQIVTTLRDWAKQHPNPDYPALSVAEAGEYSPRRLYEEVEQETELGRFFEVVIVNGASLYENGLTGVLNSFAQEATEGN